MLNAWTSPNDGNRAQVCFSMGNPCKGRVVTDRSCDLVCVCGLCGLVRQCVQDHMQHSAEGMKQSGEGHRIGRWLTRHSETKVCVYTLYYILL